MPKGAATRTQRKKKTFRSGRTTKRPSKASVRKSPARKKPPRAPKDAYGVLACELREIAVLESIAANMAWDQEAIMPPKGAALRADQLMSLSSMCHERSTSDALGDMISKAQAQVRRNGDAKMRAAVREIRRDYDKSKKLLTSLVAEITRCQSLGMDAWKEARATSNFKMFLPWLETMMNLSREKAQCYGVPKGGELYDALLDDYEPDMRGARIETIFAPLRDELVPLVRHARRSKKKPDTKRLHAATSIEKQRELVKTICAGIGFDFDAGRLDESAHPFCEGAGPGDTRMTTRYKARNWLDALTGGLHESGHGVYEQGLPKAKHFGSPLGEAVSLGIHESQSRMYENFIGRSRAFWEWATPIVRNTLGAPVRGLTPEYMYRAANVVKPSWIRVESDEVNYNLHIMLRFDLERAMLRGDLACKDLRGAWNDRFKSDFGLTVKDDALGCLQDVHWSHGLVGYFPTYSLGNIYCAQFWEAMGTDIRGRERQMARGEFGPILDWLRKKIHTKGRQYSAEQLCKRVTGDELSSEALVRHLKKKVTEVYG